MKRALEPADLFRVEHIGTVSFSPDGRLLVYERTRAAGTGPVRRLSGYDQVRKDLWMVPLGSGDGAAEPYNLTCGEETGAGAWHPTWAPGGRQLAFLQIREGRIRAEVWNANTGTIRQLTEFGIVSLYGSETPLFWLNPSVIACLTWPDESNEPGRIRAETRPGENAARLWPKAWSGSGVTAAVFESGADSTGDGESRRCHLRLIDLESGTERIRGEGALSELKPSADGRYLACFDLPCPVPQPRPGPLPRGMLSWMRPLLRVFETDGETPSWDPALPGIADTDSLRWSSSGARLALRCRPPDSPDGWPSILCQV
ncbi:MAG: hypothetical protein LC772_04920, partial [Chloroflexi bacterium]|nr:hypothetical protein [Chloroflexota bacterium]